MSDYITLQTSDAGLVKRFWAESYREIPQRSQTMEALMDGRMSIVRGRRRTIYRYVLIVPEAVADANYGTVDDLEILFNLDNPSGSPSDTLTLTRHDGEERQVRLIVSNLEIFPKGVLLAGMQAYFPITVELLDVTLQGLDFSNPDNSAYLVVAL